MAEDTSAWDSMKAALLSILVTGPFSWAGLDGATNTLVIHFTEREAARHIIIYDARGRSGWHGRADYDPLTVPPEASMVGSHKADRRSI